MKVIKEMAITRSDAIDKCISLGKQFISHFDKIYSDPNNIDVEHWSKEMQTWYNSINEIMLKNNHKYLTIPQKIDWFFEFGSSYEDYFNEDKDKIEKYEDLINYILKFDMSVLDSIKEIFNIGE